MIGTQSSAHAHQERVLGSRTDLLAWRQQLVTRNGDNACHVGLLSYFNLSTAQG